MRANNNQFFFTNETYQLSRSAVDGSRWAARWRYGWAAVMHHFLQFNNMVS